MKMKELKPGFVRLPTQMHNHAVPKNGVRYYKSISGITVGYDVPENDLTMCDLKLNTNIKSLREIPVESIKTVFLFGLSVIKNYPDFGCFEVNDSASATHCRGSDDLQLDFYHVDKNTYELGARFSSWYGGECNASFDTKSFRFDDQTVFDQLLQNLTAQINQSCAAGWAGVMAAYANGRGDWHGMQKILKSARS